MYREQMVEFAARAPNAMDFGEVQINETPERKVCCNDSILGALFSKSFLLVGCRLLLFWVVQLVLVNSGRHNFDFLWTLPGHPFLELVPSS